MLSRLEGLFGCPLVASDRDSGLIEEVYFNHPRSIARYLVIDTGELNRPYRRPAGGRPAK
jgi:hypothetical protein